MSQVQEGSNQESPRREWGRKIHEQKSWEKKFTEKQDSKSPTKCT